MRVTLFSVMLLLSLLLSACSGLGSLQQSTPTQSESTTQTEQPDASAISGVFSFMIFGDPAEKEAYENVVAAFNQQYPDIDVEVIHIPSQLDYRKRLGADFAAGAPADVVLINYRRYAAFAAKGALEPLGPMLEKSTLIKEEDFYPESLNSFRWQGVLTCIPQNLSSLVVYYNKDLFDKAGLAYPSNDWTWEDFLKSAQTLTQDSNGDGDTDIYGLGTEATIFRVTPFIWMNGGDLVDDPLNPKALAINSPAAYEALQWFIDLQNVHQVVPNAVKEAAESSESRFINGTLAMFLNSRRGVPTYRQIEAFDWDVAPLPQGKSRAGILHADAFCMPKVSENKEAAWAFIEFANSVEGQMILAESGRTVPSLKAVAESPAFLSPDAKPANSRVFLDTIPYIRAVPIMETWVDIELMVSEELELAFHGDATLDSAIDAAIIRTRNFFK